MLRQSMRIEETRRRDDPGNHLDIAGIEALESGLGGDDGALLLISHERNVLANIGIDWESALTA